MPVADLSGKEYEKLGELVKGKKVYLIVNISTGWELTHLNYV